MINIEHQQKMFLAKWAAKLLKEEGSYWARMVKHILRPIADTHAALNASVDLKSNKAISRIDSFFWQEVMKCTTTMNQNRQPAPIKTEPMWNKHILYKGSPLFFVTWCKAGLLYIQDLWVNGRLISFEEVKQHIGSNGNLQFEYNALINAIPESWKQEMNDNSMQIETPKEIVTEIGALNKLSNIKIRGFFDKKINHEYVPLDFGNAS